MKYAKTKWRVFGKPKGISFRKWIRKLTAFALTNSKQDPMMEGPIGKPIYMSPKIKAILGQSCAALF